MKSIHILLFACILALFSCKKVEGEGGLGTIRGKIRVDNYNNAGVFISTYPGAQEDVYIIYGNDDNVQDDKVECSYDGSFEFRYLNKGKYRIFVYEDCASCASGEQAIILDAEVSSKKDVIDLGEITIRK